MIKINWENPFVQFAAGMALIMLVVALCFGAWYLGLWPHWSPSADLCYGTDYRYQQPSQACLDQRFDQCLATEKYSREECAALVGGK